MSIVVLLLDDIPNFHSLLIVQSEFESQINTSIVVLDGLKGQAYTVETCISDKLTARITPLGTGNGSVGAGEVQIAQLDWEPGQVLAKVTYGSDEDILVQVLGQTPEGYQLRFRGSEQHVAVRTPEEHKFQAYMLPPEKKDVSKFLLSPMPGTLISLSKYGVYLLCLLL
ncbi:hypothetical protein EON63_06935 [archaeon]|nr:MAG: hypothetical protein EON63_06935 [archaeon]